MGMNIDYDWMKKPSIVRSSRLPYATVCNNGMFLIHRPALTGKVAVGYDEKSNIICLAKDSTVMKEHKEAVRTLSISQFGIAALSVRNLAKQLMICRKCEAEGKYRVGWNANSMFIYLNVPYVCE